MRQLLRKYLIVFTKLTVHKHGAPVIAVIGDGANSMVRELINQLIGLQDPVVQNNESPEAEFSVPLKILGIKGYPRNWWQWLKVIIKLPILHLTVPEFFHYFVVELDTIDPKIRNLWLDAIKPSYIVRTSEDIDVNTLAWQGRKRYTAIGWEQDKVVEQLLPLAIDLDIDKELAKSWLETVELPQARIRFLPGVKGSLVVDASHYYYPTSIASVVETIDVKSKDVNKLAVTTLKSDIQYLQQQGWQVLEGLPKPRVLAQQVDERTILLLRGYAPLLRHKYKGLHE